MYANLLLALSIGVSSFGLLTLADQCPTGFWHVQGFCIYTVTSPVLNTWRESYDACKAKYDSNIVMINNEFFWQAILTAGASQLNIAPGGIWMGLNYTFATNTYVWMDGTELIPSDWSLWAPGQPIQADKDKCVLLEKTYVIKKRFGWTLVDCNDPDTTGVAICLLNEGDFQPEVQGTGGQQATSVISRSLMSMSVLVIFVIRKIFE